MGKMFNATLILIAINISIFLFPKSGETQSDLISFVFNPTSWTDSTLLNSMLLGLGVSALTIGALIAIGTFVMKLDFVVFASLVIPLLALGITITNLFQFLYGFISAHVGDLVLAAILSSIFGGILALWYFFVVLDFWRGRD